MKRKERIEFLLITLCMFVSVFLVFFLVGNLEGNIQPEKIEGTRKLMSFGAAFVYCGFFTGVMFAVRFFSKRGLVFKAVAAFLWFITAFIIVSVGVVAFIPYHIYNLVKIIFSNEKRQVEALNSQNTESSDVDK